MYSQCKSIGCIETSMSDGDFCKPCNHQRVVDKESTTLANQSLSQVYPKYYKSVGDMVEIDVYAVHLLFNIQDPSGCLQHSSKKLLLSGARTGGKSTYKDVKEARDTLTRWLQLNAPSDQEAAE